MRYGAGERGVEERTEIVAAQPADSTVLTPEWVKDAVFYQIFPDRFAQSDRVEKPSNLEPWEAPPTPHGFKGGDLLGVVEHLDYLTDLGVDALYFCPIFQSTANHRYHTHDYYQVDPLLGGNAAFKVLLEAAHQRGMRVVLDGVFNHASRGFYQFNHVLEHRWAERWHQRDTTRPGRAAPVAERGDHLGRVGWHTVPSDRGVCARADAPRTGGSRVGKLWETAG